jgi:hypothetical protein
MIEHDGDFATFTAEDLPELRRIRRSGTASARRAVLPVLLRLGGEDALDERDRSTLRRLIRIKSAYDGPVSFDSCFNSWLAVRGGDQRGILDVLGLTRSEPATFALGDTLIGHLGHGGADRDEDYSHVFVSPELNGWTVVRGPSCDPDDSPQARDWVTELSARYGQAQAYFFGSRGDGDAWLVAEDGKVLRRYSSEYPEVAFGEPLPIERHWLDHYGLTGAPEDLAEDDDFQSSNWALDCSAPAVAAALSIDPVWIYWPSDVRVRGTAVIACTEAGLRQNVLRGCYTFEV